MVKTSNTTKDTRLNDEEALKLLGSMNWIYLEDYPKKCTGDYKSFYGNIKEWAYASKEAREKAGKQGVEYSVHICFKSTTVYNEDLYEKIPQIRDILAEARDKYRGKKDQREQTAVQKARGLIKKLK